MQGSVCKHLLKNQNQSKFINIIKNMISPPATPMTFNSCKELLYCREPHFVKSIKVAFVLEALHFHHKFPDDMKKLDT